MPDAVLLAHGSPDPRHARDIEHLGAAVTSAAPDLRVRTAYLDHHGPRIADLATDVAGPGEPVVVVPVLVTRAYHHQVDIPAATKELAGLVSRSILTTQPLGPHPLIGAALEELLVPHSPAGVVVLLGGASDRSAVRALEATLRAALRPGRTYAFATLDGHLQFGAALEAAGGPDGVVGVSAVIADGVLRDRMARACSAHGIPLVPGVLARTRALAELAVLRVRESLSAPPG